MTKGPQPTTHNAERGARGTCRERSEIGSSPKRTEHNVCCSLIGEISWRFGEKSLVIWRNMWRNTLAIWRKHVRRFGENIFGDLEKTCSAIWRKSFGENIGDLEKHGRRSYGDFILEFVME